MATEASVSSWFRRHRGRFPNGIRLICVPHAGAGASVFNGWAQSIPLVAELWAVQLPGRENRWREPAEINFSALAERLYLHLGGYDSTPYALFGVSMGALIAYRLAQLAAQRGRRAPVSLFVASSIAPPRYNPNRYALDDAAIIQLIRATSENAEAVLREPELWSLVSEVLRADLKVCSSFGDAPLSPLACPIVAVHGDTDPTVSFDDVSAWKTMSANEVETHSVAGGHLFPFEGAAKVLKGIIAEGLSKHGGLAVSADNFPSTSGRSSR
jgi:surfactin synthase thioesterase subunit